LEKVVILIIRTNTRDIMWI